MENDGYGTDILTCPDCGLSFEGWPEFDRHDCPDSGYCEHGVYVGGCGPDWMCGWCESGISWGEYCLIMLHRRIAFKVTREATKMRIYDILYKHGDVKDAADFVRRLVA